jgi:hypothetical protein
MDVHILPPFELSTSRQRRQCLVCDLSIRCNGWDAHVQSEKHRLNEFLQQMNQPSPNPRKRARPNDDSLPAMRENVQRPEIADEDTNMEPPVEGKRDWRRFEEQQAQREEAKHPDVDQARPLPPADRPIESAHNMESDYSFAPFQTWEQFVFARL